MPVPVDPRWPRLLGLAVHEFRTPISVVAGYIRMLLKDRAGAITDQQRRLLEEAEKSCGRLSGLVAEMSELSALEGATAAFNRAGLDLHDVLREAAAAVPPSPDRELSIEVRCDAEAAPIQGDAVRLRTAFASLFAGLRRELVDSPGLVVRDVTRDAGGARASWIAIADEAQSERLLAAQPGELTAFDEWRGGCGLSLAIARRIVSAHGGYVWGPPDGARAAAVVSLPQT